MKKIIAPLIVVILAAILIGFFVLLVFFPQVIVPEWLIKLIIGIVLLSLAGGLVAVLVKRIKEVKEEDEDDFSKY